MQPQENRRPEQVLVVDDTPANLRLLANVLNYMGLEVRTVTSGARALASAESEPPDLVLLDVMMPGMDGFETCRQIKAHPRLAAVPVMFISGLDDAEDKVRGFQAGGIDFLTKPFHLEEVEVRVRTHLEIHRLRRQLAEHNADLEQCVAERTRELAVAHGRLARLEEAKTDFLTVISQELRTPLAVLFGVTELSFDEFPDHPHLRQYQELFEESRSRLLRLVDDALLLSSARVDQMLLSRQPVAWDEVVAEAIRAVRPLSLERGLGAIEAPPTGAWVAAERAYLVRALGCLLKTALKFTRPGGPFKLESVATESHLRLVLEGTGHSVPPAELPKFFEALASWKALAPGGDLGLAPSVAAQILQLLGGTVEAVNLSNPGLRLAATLPRLAPPPGPAA